MMWALTMLGILMASLTTVKLQTEVTAPAEVTAPVDIGPHPNLTEIQMLQNELYTIKEALAYQRNQNQQLENRLALLETGPPAVTLKTVSKMIQEATRIGKSKLDEYREKQKVFFSAKLGASLYNISEWETIVFDAVENNQGNAYNNVKGEFTAPMAGTYVFFSNILSKANGIIETSLQVNGMNKMYLYSAGSVGALGAGSNMVVVHLSAGDVVKMVKHGPWGSPPFYVHASWSSFSGFLLSTDSPNKAAHPAH